MGFQPLCYRGLETGSRHVVSHVVKQNQVHKTHLLFNSEFRLILKIHFPRQLKWPDEALIASVPFWII